MGYHIIDVLVILDMIWFIVAKCKTEIQANQKAKEVQAKQGLKKIEIHKKIDNTNIHNFVIE